MPSPSGCLPRSRECSTETSLTTDELAALKTPLEGVAELREPMTRLAMLLDHPILLAGLALLGLLVWGAVTFLAVRLALLSVAGGAHADLTPRGRASSVTA